MKIPLKIRASFFLLILLIVITNSTKVQAQIPIVFEGNNLEILEPQGWGTYHLHHYTIGCDTIINNTEYSQVRFLGYQTGSIDSPANPALFEPYLYNYVSAIREENNGEKLYSLDRDSTTEILLSDFTLQLGDTFKLYAHIFSDYFTGVVDSIYYEELFGEMRKIITFGYGATNTSPFLIGGVGTKYSGYVQNGGHYEMTSIRNILYEEIGCIGGGDMVNTVFIKRDQTEISPNPANENLLVNTGTFAKNTTKSINIYNTQGQLQMQQSFQADQIELNVSGLANGIYYLVLKTEYKTESIVFVKN